MPILPDPLIPLLLLLLPALFSPSPSLSAHASPSPPFLRDGSPNAQAAGPALLPLHTLFLRQLSDLQTFTGALGGAGAAPIVESGDPERPFRVGGDTFDRFEGAGERSCDVQFQACADAVNGGGGDGNGQGGNGQGGNGQGGNGQGGNGQDGNGQGGNGQGGNGQNGGDGNRNADGNGDGNGNGNGDGNGIRGNGQQRFDQSDNNNNNGNNGGDRKDGDNGRDGRNGNDGNRGNDGGNGNGDNRDGGNGNDGNGNGDDNNNNNNNRDERNKNNQNNQNQPPNDRNNKRQTNNPTIQQCEEQRNACKQAQQAAPVKDFESAVASTNIGPDPEFPEFDLICEV